VNIPTIEEVEKLWAKYRVPENVRIHMRQVAKVAVFLAKKLKEKGIHVDVGLAERSALLHDLFRTANFENLDMQKDADADDIEFWNQLKHKYPDTHHGDIAADILKDKYPEIAEVIRGHAIENIKNNVLNAKWEVKILVYSDARVVHDKIVSLAERIKDSDVRHKPFYDELKKKTGLDYLTIIRKNILKVENEMFEIIDAKPEEVNEID